MKRIKLAMVRKDMVDIPQYSLPAGFRIRLFEKGDEQNWARVETSVDEFKDEEAALDALKTNLVHILMKWRNVVFSLKMSTEKSSQQLLPGMAT